MVTINELRRTVFSKSRLLILLILVVCSLLWQHSANRTYRDEAVQAAYQSQLSHFGSMEPEAALAEIDQIVAGSDFMAALDYVYIRPQLDHMQNYEANIAGILEQAELMSGISIFAGSPYARANIRKTAEDYTRIQGLEITMGNDLPFREVLFNSLSDALACAFMLVVVYAFLAERKRGLWNAVCSCPNGRERLALWRFGSVAAAAVITGAVFTGTELLSAYTAHGGWQELGRYVQSVSFFADWTVPMTVGQMWAAYLLLRIAGLFAVGMVAWFLLELVADWRLVGTAWALFFGGEYFLTWLPTGNLLRHINLFNYAQPRKLITTYLNLNFFGRVAGQITALAITMAVAVPIMLAVILALYRFRKPVSSYRWLDWLLDCLRRATSAFACHTSLLGHELYRILVTGKGWLVLAAAFLVIVLTASPTVTASQEVSLYLESYYRQSQGPIGPETDAHLARFQSRIEEKLSQQASLDALFAAGEISSAEYSQGMMQLSVLQEQVSALEVYTQRYETLKQTEGSYILPHWVYEILLGYQGKQVPITVVVSAVAIFLLFSVQSSTERRTGMLLSRRATPRGRKEIRLHRHLAAWILSGLFGILLWSLYLIQVWVDYTELPWLNAPVRCLSFMGHISGDISIIGYYGMQAGLRTLMLCLIASLTLGIMEVKDAYGN